MARTARLRWVATTVLTLGLLVATSACETPLKPDSAKAEQDASGSPTAQVPDRASGMGEPSPSASASTTTTAGPSPTPLATPTISPVSPLAKVSGPLLGGDVSWPQCPKGMGIPEKRTEGLPMPASDAAFVVIGLTNGPGFVANPCLADQVAYARQHHLLTAAYSVISGPTRFSPRGLTGERLGHEQARYNIASMKRAGLTSPIVWLDVETVPHFDWGPDKAENAAVIRGAAQGYREAGYAVGVYSTPYLYANVVGDLRMGVPEWRAAGQTSRAEALRRCGADWVIQGGRGVLGQWVADQRDVNTTCPGATRQIARWFHQY